MKARRIVNILSLGLIAGSVVGSAISVYHIITNRYIQYKMFRLIAFNLQRSLNNWVMLTIIISYSLFLIWLLFLSITKPTWKSFLSNIFEIHIKNKNKLRIILTWVVCSVLFFYGTWAINRYLPIDKFYTINLPCNIGILLFTIFLGWILTKIKWEKIVKSLETKNATTTALVLVMFLAILNLGIFIDGKINPPKGPNIILIVVDALRADHLSSYGYHRPTSPNIDRLSKDGITFKKAISQSNKTTLSMPSMFTSLYPSRDPLHYVAIVPEGDYVVPLGNKFVTITEILKNTGYITCAISCQPYIAPKTGFGQGFDYFNVVSNCADKFSDQKTIEKAIEWLDKNSTKNFFLFINLMGPHAPYNPPSPFDKLYDPEYKNYSKLMSLLDYFNKCMDKCKPLGTYDETKAPGIYYAKKYFIGLNSIRRDNISPGDLNHLIALYDGKIRFTDLQIGNLIDKLKALNIYKNTLIILTADHGESFLEHNSLRHGSHLYNEEIHVPLIMVFSDKLPRGTEIHHTVELVDILPTVANIARIPISGIKMNGVALYPLVGNSYYSDPYAYSKAGSHSIKYMNDKWGLIYKYKGKGCELYNLENDPGEMNNLIERKPKIASELKEKLFELINRKMPLSFHKIKPVKMSEKMKRDLKSLGYLQ